MGNIVNTLRDLNVTKDTFVTLSYTEGVDVWHINESHVEDAVGETETASMLGNLLASGLTVSDVYNEGDILGVMRDEGLLDDYDREDWFGQYLTEQLVSTIYDGEYSLEYSTEQYDYKRGRCDISTTVRVKAGALFEIEDDESSFVLVDSVVSGFEVSVQTPVGTLTLG
jgi:hypothetical protein